MFKGKSKIYIYALLVGLLGFVYSFLYQVLVGQGFEGVHFKANLTEQAEEFYLLSGWAKEKNVKYNIPYEVVWSEDKRAAMVVFLPEKETYKINLELFFPDYDLKTPQTVKVYGEGRLLTTIEPEKLNAWQTFSFFLPYKNIKGEINKFRFVSNYDNPLAYKSIEVSNFQPRNLTFPRGYMLWEGVQWFCRRPGNPINWMFCLGAFFVLPVIWLIYSFLLKLITILDFERALKINLISLLPALVIFLALYFISRLLYYYTIFYYRLDFWLIVICLVGGMQIYYLFRYVKLSYIADKVKKYFFDIKFYSHVIGNIFIISFMVLFLSCIVPLVLKQEKIAEELGNWAYLLLILGVCLKFIEFMMPKQDS